MTQRKASTRRTAHKRRTTAQVSGLGVWKGLLVFGIMLLLVAGMVWHVNLKNQIDDVLLSVQQKEKALKDVKRIYRNREARVEAFISEDYIQHQIQKYNLGLVKVSQGQVCHIGGDKGGSFRRASASKLAFIE